MPGKSAAAVALPALEKAEVSSYDPKLFHKTLPLPVFDGSEHFRRRLAVPAEL